MKNFCYFTLTISFTAFYIFLTNLYFVKIFHDFNII